MPEPRGVVRPTFDDMSPVTSVRYEAKGGKWILRDNFTPYSDCDLTKYCYSIMNRVEEW